MQESWATSERTRKSMRSNRSRDTGPEMALRHELFRRGLRYRVSFAPLTGVRRTVDIAFPRIKVAVMVDGCFWHGCPQHHKLPKSHVEYWEAKVRHNKERDASTTSLLEAAGWRVIRLWAHTPVADMVSVVEAALERPTAEVPRRGPRDARRPGTA